jgi:hypothetical protein
MSRIVRNFYARPPNEQEGIICNMPMCHGGRRLTNFTEYEEDGLITVEGECPQCGKRWMVQFRSLRELP